MRAPEIVPRPRRLELGDDELPLGPQSSLGASGAARAAVSLVRSVVRCATGFELRDAGEDATVLLRLEPDSSLGEEGYRVKIDRERVVMTAGQLPGLRNAAQTLRQLLPRAACDVEPAGVRLCCMEIEDAPALSWRGVLLDVARHFLPLPFLFRFVDLLALHKMNVLHLHLNDDQGWRFPSLGYPRLAEIASWRSESRIGHQLDTSRGSGVLDGTPHGGYYELLELRSLVAYAAERNVTIVPEIDLPGHAQAAIAAYPELGNVGPVGVWTSWGVSEHVLNLDDSTLGFCRGIWDEVLDVFPSRYVHIGGDECPRIEWERSSSAAERARALGLSGPEALQGWFTRQMVAHLTAAGRRPVGWDEILESGPLPPGATVMSWRGEAGGISAARDGFDVVMCPEEPCYLDHYQSSSPDEPLGFGYVNTFEDVCRWDPVPAGLDGEASAHVLGAQATLWTEYMPTPRDVEYMAFPRCTALAEVAWRGGPVDPDELRVRLATHLARLDALGVGYRPFDGPFPWQRGGTGARQRFDR